jgi:hypothetical protein
MTYGRNLIGNEGWDWGNYPSMAKIFELGESS